jgi:hypothetical protein
MAAIASLTPSLWAQIPAPPPVPAAPAAPAVIQVVQAPPPKKTLLEQCTQMKANCKAAICASPLGALLNGVLAPVSAVTGGIVPGFCPGPNTPNPADLAKPPDSAEGAAAAIKKSEAEAKARRAAVRYLGTVDCHWFPEAEAALVNALRADTNECVRLEAALALGHGCCCSKKTIAALAITVSGSNKDGKPSENSERVKAAAFFALQHCLACFSETTVVESKEPPKLPIEPAAPAPPTPPVEKPTAMLDAPLPAYYKGLENVPLQQVVEEARRTLAGGINKREAVAHRNEDHSLYAVLSRAMNPPAAAAETKATTVERTPAVSPAPLVGEETSAARPTSLIGWLKSRSSESVAAAPASVPAAMPSSKPAPAVQPAASPPAVQTVSAAVAARADERREAEFPTPGATAVTVKQLLAVLRQAPSVPQRAWAADNLAKVNWRENPAVAEALLKAARQDTAPSVRQTCVRSLMNMGVYTPAAMAVFQTLKADPDGCVRLEAEAALRNLGSSPTP